MDADDSLRVPIVVLAGPTAVGKTAAAVELCQRLDAEIVGADSVQIYRGLVVGSAKPSSTELHGVAHHLLDCIEPSERIDAARYARLADECIAEVASRGRKVVVVGGTGLWLRSLVRGLMPAPAVDPQLRATLEARWDLEGGAALHAQLDSVDPVGAARIHPHDKRRVVRALELHTQTGHAAGELRAAHALGAPRRPTLMLWLDRPMPEWELRVTERVGSMLRSGLVEETEQLVAKHGSGAPALRSVGYRQVLEYLAGSIPRDELQARVIAATRRYAHQQRNWLRTDPSVSATVSPDALLREPWLERIRSHFDGNPARA